ncbi:MAG TPA: peptide chain release factor 1 [Acidimicrobiia bacterium]|nr:peptide chain release factor 1 [Acidimicrobiia bacterium]
MDHGLAERLEEVEEAFREVEAQLADPATGSDPSRYAELGRRHAELGAIVDLLEQWRRAMTDRSEALELAAEDPEMAPELKRLADEREAEAERLEAELRRAMIPKDPNDDKDVILEIRAAAGGDEAAIWAGDLLRMYERFAESEGFKIEPMESSPSEAGGYNRVVVAVKGRGAYSRLKYEAGVHRVQRVPKTESQGRIHTSTATVAVLPEADEVEVDIDPNDVKVDVFRSQGPGGQSVNTTDSAVRLTHLPTGLVVSVQDEKSQLQNKEKAFRILRARLLAARQAEQAAEVAGERRAQVGTGERSEKIRTYNFKESRVTDHRIGLTIRRLDDVLEGELQEFVDALSAAEQAEKLVSG